MSLMDYLGQLSSATQPVKGDIGEISVILFPGGRVEFHGLPPSLPRHLRFSSGHKAYAGVSTGEGEGRIAWRRASKRLVEEGLHVLLLLDPRTYAATIAQRLATAAPTTIDGKESVVVNYDTGQVCQLAGMPPSVARFESITSGDERRILLQVSNSTLELRVGYDRHAEENIARYPYSPANQS